MPRSNRPRSRRGSDRLQNDVDDVSDPDRMRAAVRRTELKRSGTYVVQSVPAAAAVKIYLCPSCRTDVPIGQAHIVAWRADGPMNDDTELASRRHWHSHCWRMEP